MSAFAERVLANVREEIRDEVAYALELAGEPELLEALKALKLMDAYLDFSEGLEPGVWGVEDPSGINATFEQAAAAIAKADAKP